MYQKEGVDYSIRPSLTQREEIKSRRLFKSGFSLIELIVVMAVIGVLVLLAAPKFLNYTGRARETQIRNDIKVLEAKIDEYLISHDKLPDEWGNAVPGDGQLYDRTGPIASLPLGEFKVVDRTFYPETNLGGDYYSDKDGNVIYEDDGSSFVGENPNDDINQDKVQIISTGVNHSLLLMSDGTVKAWGNNIGGALGMGDIINRSNPTTIPGLKNVKEVLASFHYSFALMEDGTIKAWGKICLESLASEINLTGMNQQQSLDFLE